MLPGPCMMSNDMNGFWRDVKKNANSNVSFATNVDGSVGDTEIAEMWKCHNKSLLPIAKRTTAVIDYI